ncbi:MAG TPA: L,D-transpeptidase [Burkholderiales bacterium]|nr:L,D-transpeptidase [Burkholderiales bacterium]
MKRLYAVTVSAALAAAVFAPRALHDSGIHVVAVPPRAQFGELAASDDTRDIADRIVRTADNGGLPFFVIDKRAAAIYVFDAAGRARASAPVLLGMALGDRFAPGVADKDMYQTQPSERITPAGRFLAQPGINDQGQDVVWIQYDAGIAMHAVLDTPGQRRRERLATATPDDNRVSYGCVNLPTDFYRDVVRPLFDSTRAVVYVLPDSESPLALFARN